MVEYLRNAWYAATWADDVPADALVPVEMLGEPIVVFRNGDGTIQAIADRCPHRFAPLSMGVHKGDRIACRYHGLEFDGGGRCVHSPFTGEIPATAHIRSYAACERNAIVWIWGGDPAMADAARIPDYGFLDGKNLNVRGVTLFDAYYELATDNLMDLSHAGFLHQQAFGPTDQTVSQRTLTAEGDDIVMDWLMPESIGASGFDPLFASGDQPMDIWLNLRWSPAANIRLEVGMTMPGSPRDAGKAFSLINLLTPIDEGRTRYLWAAVRGFPVPDEAIADEVMLGVMKHAFDQDDKPMIEACFQRMNCSTDLLAQRPVLLPTDAGAMRCRRRLAALIKSERDTTGQAPEAYGSEL